METFAPPENVPFYDLLTKTFVRQKIPLTLNYASVFKHLEIKHKTYS
jgi:hypothetical protein